ncbi:MAG: PEP-CTERM sorting domain-containing protein [Pirellulales bacterium]|nr:PEP-CTERM sorting domain-containing protein [Pirellulales bacterium]
MKNWIMVCAAFMVLVVAASASASIEGDTIQGVLNFGGFPSTNYFDPASTIGSPAHSSVPAGSSGIQPSAVVTSDDASNGYVELMYLNDRSGVNVDVDANTVTIDWFVIASPYYVEMPNGWTIYLNDVDWLPSGGGLLGVTEISDTFDTTLGSGVTATLLSDSSIQFSFAGAAVFAEHTTAVYRLSGIPEPATILIWSLLGGLGMVAVCRRRKRAS